MSLYHVSSHSICAITLLALCQMYDLGTMNKLATFFLSVVQDVGHDVLRPLSTLETSCTLLSTWEYAVASLCSKLGCRERTKYWPRERPIGAVAAYLVLIERSSSTVVAGLKRLPGRPRFGKLDSIVFVGM